MTVPTPQPTLFTEFWPRLLRYCLRRVANPMDAQDLAAQTVLRALDAERRGLGWHTQPYGWLYRIAHNLIVDEYKSAHQRVTDFPLDDCWTLDDPAQDLETHAERLEAAETVTRLLAPLTNEQRQALTLHYLDGYSYEEVGQLMGKRVGSVKGLRHRGLQTMRNYVGKERSCTP